MNKHYGILAACLLAASPSYAGEAGGLFNTSDLQWFGSLSSAYMDANGDINFYGNTASVYGGSPSIAMDDGRLMSLAFGFATPDGWRLFAEVGQARLNSSTGEVFGFDDRIDDTFRVDAEIESLVLMLNGSYDFDIGLDRIAPYFEGGVGLSRNKSARAILDVSYDSLIWNGTSLDDQQLVGYSFPGGETTEFAWNASLGLRMKLWERFNLSLSYGVIDLGEAVTETDAAGDALGIENLDSQQLQLGIEFEF